jgi:hypothetical protein
MNIITGFILFVVIIIFIFLCLKTFKISGEKTDNKETPIKKRPKNENEIYRIKGPGTYGFKIAGASNYQEALSNICGGKTDEGHEKEVTALLTPDPKNQYDPNAIKVTIDDQLVGYVGKKYTAGYRLALKGFSIEEQPIGYHALIVGGWNRGGGDEGHFGVNIDIPDQFLECMGIEPDILKITYHG